MRVIEIPENRNCAAVAMRVFHDLEPPQPLTQVRLQRTSGEPPAWYAITGWTSAGTPCPASLQKVEDSGEGVAVLLTGGDAGIRLKPAGSDEPWGLNASQQWGEPFLLLATTENMRESDG